MDNRNDDQNPMPPGGIAPPPIVVPPTFSAPPTYEPVYRTPEPLSRPVFGKVALSVVVVLVITALNLMRLSNRVAKAREQQSFSGVVYKGHALDRAEIVQASDDMTGIIGNSAADDAGSLNTHFPAKSEIGRAFEGLMRELQVIEADYQKAAKETNSNDYLSPAQLGTDSGRAKARQQHKSYVAAAQRYWEGIPKWNIHLSQFAHDMSSGAGDQSFVAGKISQLQRLDNANSERVEQLLDLADHARPTFDKAANKLVFSSQGFDRKYEGLRNNISAYDKAFNKLQDPVVASRASILEKTFKPLAESAALEEAAKS
jgi:hypothetical protein